MAIVVPDKRALIVTAREPARIIDTIPMAQYLGDHMVAVPHRTDTFLALKNMGAKLGGFEPISHYYRYPPINGLYEPMPHQKVTAAFMSSNLHGFVLNQQRTGKTAAAIWATDFLMQDRAVASTLVICTMSNMRKVWQDGVFSIAPHRTVGILHGSKQDRLYTLSQPFDYYVINHDGVKVISDELADVVGSGKIQAVVVDELTELAEYTTDLWKATQAVAWRAKFLMGMTATPMSRGPERVFGQVRLINKEMMPMSFPAWQAMTMLPIKMQVENKKTKRMMTITKWLPRADAVNNVHDVLQPVIRFAKKDVLPDLPPITHTLLEVGLSAEQKRVISSLRNKGGAVIDTSVLTVANAGVLAQKILQVCGGAVFDSSGVPVPVDVSPKIDELVRLASNTEQKVVVFATYQPIVDLIVTVLKKRQKELGGGVAWVDGRVVGRARDRAIDAFYHDSSVKFGVFHPETTAHGLEFSMADTTVWWTLTRSRDHFLQANERMASAAQKNPMGIYYLIGNALEEGIYRALVDGENVQERLFALMKQFVVTGQI